MSGRDDGGAAFPVSVDRWEDGMSLRDWFAGMALQGALASRREVPKHEADRAADFLAFTAYHLADAMLAQRNTPNPEDN